VKGAVARAEVANAQARFVNLQLGVPTRDRGIEDGDVAGWSTPDDELHTRAQLVLLQTIRARQSVPHRTWHRSLNMQPTGGLASNKTAEPWG
jgi:hypothetical protein